MKKFFAFALTVVMLFAMTINAFATTLTITEPEDAGDATYAGYKILNSTNNADNTELFAYTLNEKYTAILQSVTGKTTEADIVAYISDLSTDGMRTFANDVYAAIKAANPAIAADKTLSTGANTVDEGYWLIAQTSEAGKLETQSLVIVDTAGKESLTIESKKSTFTVDKTVTDESQLKCTKLDPDAEDYDADHTHTAACWDWTKTNESPVGATVKFQIATAVPANMAGYKYDAYFIVGDILGQGLTLDKNSIEVYIDGTKVGNTAYTVRFSDSTPACEEGYTFQVALVDPKANAGKNVVVYYSAMVNEDAELKLTGNPNEADVTYNPKSNEDYGGTSEGGFPKNTTIDVDGKTPKSLTLTYATGIQFQKVDENMKALDGAEFTITGTTETTKLEWYQDYVKVANGETGTFYKLTDGKFTDKAPVADKMEAQVGVTKFDGGYVVAADTDAAAGTDKTVDGVRYREATETDFSNGTTIYTFVEGNVGKYAETTPSYKYVEGWKEKEAASSSIDTTVAVDGKGIANLAGLGAGTYYITESVVPEGFNKIDDFQVKITWTAPTAEDLAEDGEEAKCTWTAQLLDKDGKAVEDEQGNAIMLSLTKVNDLWDLFGLQVVNESGVELPSTGGIGTTIFYVVGGILLVGAAILLITKKRMSTER